MNKFLKIILCIVLLSQVSGAFALEDEFADKMLSDKFIEPPETHEVYDYQDTTAIPVKISASSTIKSEKDAYEGQIIEFKTAENVIYKHNVIIPKGTPVTARVETVISNGMNGIPASIILGNFKIDGIESSKLTSSYEKFGLDLSWLVFPLKWLLTPFPPTGTLTNFIKGGHVKIKEGSTITLFYHPNWI